MSATADQAEAAVSAPTGSWFFDPDNVQVRADGVTGRPQSIRGDEAAGTVRAERDRGEEDQSAAEISLLFLGSDPVDDRGRGRSVR